MKRTLFAGLVISLFVLGCAGQSPKSTTDATAGATAKASNSGKAAEKTTAQAAGNSVKCTWKTEERVITQEATSGGGCQVVYTKNGNKETVGSSANDASVCSGIATRIQNNLESNGFQCSKM